MFELFVVGTFWFWALLIAEIILLFVFVEFENGVGATISLLIFGAALQWCGNVDIISFIAQNPLKVLAILGAYAILGSLWGVVKWWVYCRDKLEEYNDVKADFLQSHGCNDTTMVPESLRSQWASFVRSLSDRQFGKPPRAADNKSRIIRWMSFWVISLIWTVLDDFVKRVFKVIYYKIAGFLQRISDRMFADVSKDFEID